MKKHNITLCTPRTNRLGRLGAAIGMVGLLGSLALGQADEQTPPPTDPADAVQEQDADEQEPSKTPPADAPNLAIITLYDDMIDDVTFTSIKRRAEQAIEEGANIIVLEIDTPGGMVSSSVDIATYMRRLSENRGIKTVAWVHDEAISGGTMVAMGCEDIVMSRTSTIGDCGVIIMGAGGASTAQDPALDAKIESYVLSVFESAASRNGYDPLLCESFVRYEIEVWWLENPATGERRFLDPKEKEKLLGKSSDSSWASPLESGAGQNKWRLVETYVDPLDGKEKKLRQPVISDSKLLTMDQSMATVLGFCKALIRDEAELKEYYGVPSETQVARFEQTWSELMVSWLTSPWVRMILIAMMGMGAYAEFQTPGLGLPGLVAVIALMLFLSAPYMTGLANVWEIIIIFLGMALILVEVFLIPGFGVAGVSGVVLLVIGLLATFMPENPSLPTGPGQLPFYWPELPESFEGLKTGVVTLAGGLVIGVVGMVALSRYLPQIPYLKHAVPPNPTAEGVAISDVYDGLARIGDVGRCESPLRPAGKARFGSLLVDVVSEGDMVEAGTEIEVVDRRGNRVVVRPIQES